MGATSTVALYALDRWIIGNAAGAFDFPPFGVAEIRRQDEHNIAAFIDGSLQGSDPVVAPSNGLDIKETADTIASQPTIQFFDKLFVPAAMTEEDLIRGRGHWSILSPDIAIHDLNCR
jgi:hypothetical protein